MDSYFSMSIQGLGLQVLETTHIIATSKNFDTIKSRYELLIERLNTLKKFERNPNYSSDINAATETYKSMYFNRALQDYQFSAALKPNDFDFQKFYCQALVDCMERFVEEQINEIAALKTENSKIKRKTKVSEKIQIAKSELKDKCSTIPSYESTLSKIENLQATLNARV